MRPKLLLRRDARAGNSVGELTAEVKRRIDREVDPGAKSSVNGEESAANSHSRMNPWRQNLQGFFFCQNVPKFRLLAVVGLGFGFLRAFRGVKSGRGVAPGRAIVMILGRNCLTVGGKGGLIHVPIIGGKNV